jgi:hypothetical protein
MNNSVVHLTTLMGVNKHIIIMHYWSGAERAYNFIRFYDDIFGVVKCNI